MCSSDFLLETLAVHGGRAYGGEAVTQLDHALQCASLAEAEEASGALVTAALVHDIGHLLHQFERDAIKRGFDDAHEERGAEMLTRWFGPEVTEPVRLHVPAKRYLCAVEPGYWESLSRVSKRTLDLQGGIFTDAEAAAFIAQPFAADAVRVRRWDDLAKVAGRTVLPPDHFRAVVQAAMRVAPATAASR